MGMSIVFHLTVNMKFCICLAVYKYTSNVSRSQTTLASLLSPTAHGFPAATSTGCGVWLESPSSSCSRSGGNSHWPAQVINYRLLFFLEFPCAKKSVHHKNTWFRSVLTAQKASRQGPCCPGDHCGFPYGEELADTLHGSCQSVITKCLLLLTLPAPNFQTQSLPGPRVDKIEKQVTTQFTKIPFLMKFHETKQFQPKYVFLLFK